MSHHSWVSYKPSQARAVFVAIWNRRQTLESQAVVWMHTAMYLPPQAVLPVNNTTADLCLEWTLLCLRPTTHHEVLLRSCLIRIICIGHKWNHTGSMSHCRKNHNQSHTSYKQEILPLSLLGWKHFGNYLWRGGERGVEGRREGSGGEERGEWRGGRKQRGEEGGWDTALPFPTKPLPTPMAFQSLPSDIKVTVCTS